MTAIVDFLQGTGTDGAGRTVFQVIALNDASIEGTHDFIQWLFPLAEPSGANRRAPVLSASDVEAVQACGMAQCALAAATDRMARFYGHNTHWLTAHDHNHLRITRIIKSLRLLRGSEEADAFRALVFQLDEAAGHPVSDASRRYWANA